MTDCAVGFDTSNYTTSIAVCTLDGKVVANLKKPLPVKAGQRGLRQSDAVFEHTRNLPELAKSLKIFLAENDLRPVAVGVSATPRDAEGSYMPCFLSGVAAAEVFSSALNIPLYKFSHQNGHIMAAVYSSGETARLKNTPFVAFHVSGGTTEALYVEPNDNGLSVTLAGETDDINAGQLIDRVGVMMGLSFPAGREMERLASEYRGKIYRHPICVRDGRCSLSGGENIAARLYEGEKDEKAVAAFVFDFVCRTLLAMGEDMEERFGRTPVLFAGGVMSNKLMRERLSARFDACYAEPEFSADNAAGIAILCRNAYLNDLK
ncbi:MAG: peptidase M22 [Clostridia bacterium]|nr:peptidase M22 [Clostridia bacterium]